MTKIDWRIGSYEIQAKLMAAELPSFNLLLRLN